MRKVRTTALRHDAGASTTTDDRSCDRPPSTTTSSPPSETKSRKARVIGSSPWGAGRADVMVLMSSVD
jgi:hypothetical protein